jgi:hypothetical protein
MVLRRALIMLSLYGLVDLYRIYSNNQHKRFLNTSKEVLEG